MKTECDLNITIKIFYSVGIKNEEININLQLIKIV